MKTKNFFSLLLVLCTENLVESERKQIYVKNRQSKHVSQKQVF